MEYQFYTQSIPKRVMTKTYTFNSLLKEFKHKINEGKNVKLRDETNYVISMQLKNLLKKSKIEFQNIMPLTYFQFANQNQLSTTNQNSREQYFHSQSTGNQNYERYLADMQRRKTQIFILQQMSKNHTPIVQYQNKHYIQTQTNLSQRRLTSKPKSIRQNNLTYRTKMSELRPKHFSKNRQISSAKKNQINRFNDKRSTSKQSRKLSCISGKSDSRNEIQKISKQIQNNRIPIVSFRSLQGKPYIEQYLNSKRKQSSVRNLKNTKDFDRFQQSPFLRANSHQSKMKKRSLSKIGKISRPKFIADKSSLYQKDYLSEYNDNVNQKTKPKSSSKPFNLYEQNNTNYYQCMQKRQINIQQAQINEYSFEKLKKLPCIQRKDCQALLQSVKRYESVNLRHNQQLKYLGKDNRQKQRLIKLHEIEKYELKREIDRLRTRIQSKQNHKKYQPKY